MRVALQYIGWVIGLTLEVLVIASVLRGGYRRFPLILAYTVGLLLTTAIEIPANLAYFSGTQLAHSRAFYYWLDEGIRQGLLFALVISLSYYASRTLQARALLRFALICGAVIFAGASFLIHYDSTLNIGRWMTLWCRDLNFSSAILDLVLWAMLLSSQKRDIPLLMLSGALGLQFTGEAIGQTLRNQFPAILLMADFIIMAVNLACLYIWWQVLRGLPAVKRRSVATF